MDLVAIGFILRLNLFDNIEKTSTSKEVNKV